MSGESRRDRTFPPADADPEETAASSSSRPRRRSDEAAVPGAAPSDAARGDASPARPSADGESLRERVARLERENEALRRKVEEAQRARQDVIDHYERVIDDIDGASSASASSAEGTSATSRDGVSRPTEQSSATPTVRPPAPDTGLADKVARRLDVRERLR
ncbi:hypothetical protein [Halopelagius fulvigenes]|uniref:Uncharacterized protein n=1 Tax=Halopelagius fulvigenes TaxID=1198324 RepID=A0ABD5U2T0_9EURY